jgi:hypothetical protein
MVVTAARLTDNQLDSNYCKVVDLTFGNYHRQVDQVPGWLLCTGRPTMYLTVILGRQLTRFYGSYWGKVYLQRA